MSMGPGGDGALYTTAFMNGGFERLIESNILKSLAPEARFILPNQSSHQAPGQNHSLHSNGV